MSLKSMPSDLKSSLKISSLKCITPSKYQYSRAKPVKPRLPRFKLRYMGFCASDTPTFLPDQTGFWRVSPLDSNVYYYCVFIKNLFWRVEVQTMVHIDTQAF